MKGGLRSSFSMKTYFAVDGAGPALPPGAGERAAQLASLRYDEARHGPALRSMLRVAALLHEVDTAGVAPLECLCDGQALVSSARDQSPFAATPSGVRAGQLLLLPPVQQRD